MAFTTKVEAVKSVLSIFGEEGLQTLEHYLKEVNGFSLTDEYSLERLYFALSRLVGIDAAALLMESIYLEIDRLAAADSKDKRNKQGC